MDNSDEKKLHDTRVTITAILENPLETRDIDLVRCFVDPNCWSDLIVDWAFVSEFTPLHKLAYEIYKESHQRVDCSYFSDFTPLYALLEELAEAPISQINYLNTLFENHGLFRERDQSLRLIKLIPQVKPYIEYYRLRERKLIHLFESDKLREASLRTNVSTTANSFSVFDNYFYAQDEMVEAALNSMQKFMNYVQARIENIDEGYEVKEITPRF